MGLHKHCQVNVRGYEAKKSTPTKTPVGAQYGGSISNSFSSTRQEHNELVREGSCRRKRNALKLGTNLVLLSTNLINSTCQVQ